MPAHQLTTRGLGQSDILIGVGGQDALLRSLRALARGGDNRASPMYSALLRAQRRAVRQVVQVLRQDAPVGNYRALVRGRRVARRRNTRKVYRGEYAGQQQPAGELRRSIRAATRRGQRVVIAGGDSAYYIRAVIAGHTTPSGGRVPPNSFVWRNAPTVREHASAVYEQEVRQIARDFTDAYGQTQFRSLSSRQRRAIGSR